MRIFVRDRSWRTCINSLMSNQVFRAWEGLRYAFVGKIDTARPRALKESNVDRKCTRARVRVIPTRAPRVIISDPHFDFCTQRGIKRAACGAVACNPPSPNSQQGQGCRLIHTFDRARRLNVKCDRSSTPIIDGAFERERVHIKPAATLGYYQR